MTLFYVTRPAPLPTTWDGQRGALVHQYTRFGPMQHSRDAAVRRAARVGGRAYEYDGEHRLIYECAAPREVSAERVLRETVAHLKRRRRRAARNEHALA